MHSRTCAIGFAVALLGCASTVVAVDIVDCAGTTVPAGQVGSLVADLDCTAPENPQSAVNLERGATLLLNGYVLAGNLHPVTCRGTRCTVIGPGTVTSSSHVIIGRTVRVKDATIGGAHHCIEADRVIVEGSTITNCGDVGIHARGRVRVLDSTVADGGGRGIEGQSVVVKNVTVTGNGATGIYAFPRMVGRRAVAGWLRAADSTVTGNGGLCPAEENVGCFDLRGRRVRVRNTTYDTCAGCP
jgi:hypothetical protein